MRRELNEIEAFLPDFSAIHTPVSLRPFLARPVGESVGVFVGSADIKMRYRASRGGGTTSVGDSSVLTVYTIEGRMHLHLLASELEGAAWSVHDDSARAVHRLLRAVT